VRTRRAALLLVLATALPRLLALLHERGSDPRVVHRQRRRPSPRRSSHRDLWVHPRASVGLHAAALRLVSHSALLDLRTPLGGRGIAQICIAVLTTLIVWQIGRRWLTPTIGLIAGLIVAVHPYLVWHDVHMNREILDHLLASAIVYLTLHAAERFGWRRALPLGAAIGLGVLGNVRLEGLRSCSAPTCCGGPVCRGAPCSQPPRSSPVLRFS